MNRFDSILAHAKSNWLDRLGAFLEVLLLSGVFSSFLAALPLSLRGSGREILLKDARIIAGFVLLEAVITLILLVRS